MHHRRLVETALACLPADRALYFHDVANKLDQDLRAGRAANVVYTVFAAIAPLAPIGLDPGLFIDRLLDFVTANETRINKVLFSRAYVVDSRAALGPVVNELLAGLVDEVLRKAEAGEIDTREPEIVRIDGTDR